MFNKSTIRAAKDRLRDRRPVADGGSKVNATDTHFENFDSELRVEIPATKVETLREEGGTTEQFRTEGTYERIVKLQSSLVNFDAFFNPAYDWKSETETGDVRVIYDYDEMEFTFTLYADELLAAAEQRAAEDAREVQSVLSRWLRLARDSERAGNRVEKQLQKAKQAAE